MVEVPINALQRDNTITQGRSAKIRIDLKRFLCQPAEKCNVSLVFFFFCTWKCHCCKNQWINNTSAIAITSVNESSKRKKQTLLMASPLAAGGLHLGCGSPAWHVLHATNSLFAAMLRCEPIRSSRTSIRNPATSSEKWLPQLSTVAGSTNLSHKVPNSCVRGHHSSPECTYTSAGGIPGKTRSCQMSLFCLETTSKRSQSSSSSLVFKVVPSSVQPWKKKL